MYCCRAVETLGRIGHIGVLDGYTGVRFRCSRGRRAQEGNTSGIFTLGHTPAHADPLLMRCAWLAASKCGRRGSRW
jgi:hypothetical protein